MEYQKNVLNEPEIFDTESQCKMILEWLMKGKTLTNLEGLKNFDALACRSRIANLRAKGHDIKTEMITLPNRKRVARYSMTLKAK